MKQCHSQHAGGHFAVRSPAIALAIFTGTLSCSNFAATNETRVIEEIIVSATRKDTLLQHTGMAITALDSAMLESDALQRVSDLSTAVPSLSMGIDANSGGLQMTMRGISSNNNTAAGNPAVSMNLDSVYVPRPTGADALFYDIARVEIMRGPQGTLFGRNSTAGAINVITQPPVDHIEAELQLEAGNYDRQAIRGLINYPVTDQWFMRASAQRDERDGYFDNSDSPVNTDDYSGADQTAARITSLYEPTGTLSWQLIYEYFKDNGTPTLGVPNPLPPGEDIFDRAVSTAGNLHQESTTIRSRVDWDFSASVRLSYIAGGGDSTNKKVADVDGGITPLNRASHADFKNTYYSHDLQLQSIGESRLDWTAGLYYFEESTDSQFSIENVEPGTAVVFTIDDLGQRAVAAYAQGTYSIRPDLRFTLGARYTQDEKYVDNDQFNFCFLPPGATSSLNLNLDECILIRALKRNENYDAWTGRIALDFDVTDNFLWYGSVANGFKSGGFGAGTPPFDEETVTTYETGIKSTFYDNTVRINSALYYSSYDDLQVLRIVDATQQVDNAGKSTIEGLELEWLWLLGGNTQIDGFLNWTDARYDKYTDVADQAFPLPGGGTLDLSGNQLPNSPEWSYRIAIEHQFQFGAYGNVTPRLMYYWEDHSYLREFNRGDVDKKDAWSTTDLTVMYRPQEGSWNVLLYGKNLNDNVVPLNSFVAQDSLTSSYNNPRTYGVQFTYDW